MKASTVSGGSSSPSSWWWWRGKRQVTCSASPSSTSAQRWRGAAAGAYVVVVPPGGGHGSVSTNRGQALKAATHSDGEAADRSSASLLKQHGETAVVVRLVVEIGVIRLGPTFDRRLKNERTTLKRL